ncbi:hypothetical protein QYE76_030823 [Lolium multiflorum]|uniref:Reverse transcriptase Ty1/copia-type domain-containing protein n=1 Tax=Lolium multiflorum TaxID=4521 RepID=A0AAD8QRJ4_LOLMU|nr:hypothetical protein QYE76_030823 [Lolium multiflorum]
MSITLGEATKLLDNMMINYSEWHTERAPQGKKVNSVEESSSLNDKVDAIMSMLANDRTNVDPNNVPLASLVAQEEHVDVNFIKNNNFNNNAYRNNSSNNYRPYPYNNGNGYANSYGNSYNNNRNTPPGLEAMLKEFISTQTAFNKSVEEKLNKIDILVSRVDSLASDVDLLKSKVMPNRDIENKIVTTANAIQVRINENIRLMAELRARWDREENEKLAKKENVAKVWTITTTSNANDSHVAAPPTINDKIIGVGNASTPSAKRAKLPETAKTAETACDKTAEIFSNLGDDNPIALDCNDLDFDDCHISEVIKFLQKLAKSPNASAINLAFTKHITNALIKAREEKLKLETSIPRKLEDGWEPIIKMRVKDFDCNALCDLGASISVMPKKVYDMLDLPPLKNCYLDVNLADNAKKKPLGRVDNVHIMVNNNLVPVDFVVLDIECNASCPIILGRPFLRTVGATIDMKEGNIKYQFPLKKGMEHFPRKRMKLPYDSIIRTNYDVDASNPSNEIFSELDETKTQGPISPRTFQKTEEHTKWGHEVAKPQGGAAKGGPAPPCGVGPSSEGKIFVAKNGSFLEKEFLTKEVTGRKVELDEVIEPSLVDQSSAVPEDVPVQPTPIGEEANDNDHETSNEVATEPRRSTRERTTPDWYDPCLNVMIVDNNDEDPATYEEAMMSPDSNKWQEAMKSEMGSMYDNQVWTLVDLPDSRKAVENKWIFKRKIDADGNITVYKARLVAKGFRQIQGVDYDETFSPVAKLKSVRILLAIAAFFDYEIWQMDVKTAFLNGDIEEELYMVQPKGFVDPKNADKVCKLQRSIYGLKQASRSWNRRFDKVIKDFGFIQTHGEACIYKKVSGSSVAFLILYVDDILLIGNDIELLSSVKGYLNKCFSMKDLGEAAYILGIKIYRDRSRRLIGLSQSTYLDKILKKFRMDESKKGFLPMLPGKVLSKTQGPATAEERERMNKIPYASAVGSIMYAMLCTRPDIAHAVSLTSRYQSDPGMEHWTAVKNILKYLKRTKDMFLCYGGDQELVVTSYTDASWNTDPDDSKSQSGYVFILNGAAVSWSSSKQCTAKVFNRI